MMIKDVIEIEHEMECEYCSSVCRIRLEGC